MRRSFRTPIQKLPLDKSQKSASKSFVIPPDQTEMETPRTNIEGLLTVAETESKVTRSSQKPGRRTSERSSINKTFKSPSLSKVIAKRKSLSSNTNISSPGSKLTPRTNIWNLLMNSDKEQTPVNGRGDIQHVQSSGSHVSTIEYGNWGQQVTLSPLNISPSREEADISDRTETKEHNQRNVKQFNFDKIAINQAQKTPAEPEKTLTADSKKLKNAKTKKDNVLVTEDPPPSFKEDAMPILERVEKNLQAFDSQLVETSATSSLSLTAKSLRQPKSLTPSGSSLRRKVTTSASRSSVKSTEPQELTPPVLSVYDISDSSSDEVNTPGGTKKPRTAKKKTTSSTKKLGKQNISRRSAVTNSASKQAPQTPEILKSKRNFSELVLDLPRSSTPVQRGKSFFHSTKLHDNSAFSQSQTSSSPPIPDLSPIRHDWKYQNEKDHPNEHIENVQNNLQYKEATAIEQNIQGVVLDSIMPVPAMLVNQVEASPLRPNIVDGMEELSESEAVRGQVYNYTPEESPAERQYEELKAVKQVVGVGGADEVGGSEPFAENEYAEVGGIQEEQQYEENRLPSSEQMARVLLQEQEEESSDNLVEQTGNTAERKRKNPAEGSDDEEGYELPSGLSPLTTPHISMSKKPRMVSTVQQVPRQKSKKSSQVLPRKLLAPTRKKPTNVQITLPRNSVKFFAERHSSMKLSKDAIDMIINVSEIFWDDTFKALEAYALHAGRRIINQKDVVLLMKTQRLINGTSDLHDHIREYLPMELRSELIPVAKSCCK